QQRARHERCVIGREKQDARRDLFGRARPLQDRALGGVLAVLLERPPELARALLMKGREDRPGTHGVHPDAVPRVIHRHAAREPGDRGLGGVVLRGLADASASRSTWTSTKNALGPISAATRLPRSTSRSANATLAPSVTNRRTVASPMPDAPPVTAATLPLSRAMARLEKGL